jgi:hypothetical protein
MSTLNTNVNKDINLTNLYQQLKNAKDENEKLVLVAKCISTDQISVILNECAILQHEIQKLSNTIDIMNESILSIKKTSVKSTTKQIPDNETKFPNINTWFNDKFKADKSFRDKFLNVISKLEEQHSKLYKSINNDIDNLNNKYNNDKNNPEYKNEYEKLKDKLKPIATQVYANIKDPKKLEYSELYNNVKEIHTNEKSCSAEQIHNNNRPSQMENEIENENENENDINIKTSNLSNILDENDKLSDEDNNIKTITKLVNNTTTVKQQPSTTVKPSNIVKTTINKAKSTVVDNTEKQKPTVKVINKAKTNVDTTVKVTNKAKTTVSTEKK